MADLPAGHTHFGHGVAHFGQKPEMPCFFNTFSSVFRHPTMKKIYLSCTLLIFLFTHAFGQSLEKECEEKFTIADSLVNAGNLQGALDIHYELLEKLEKNPKEEEDYTWLSKNYYKLSNVYLFLNDTLSTLYADKAIQSAFKTSNNALIERSYSLKYYCLYDVPGKSNELNFIADKCIEYSLLVDNNSMLAEAYMHKCNALVELNQVDAGDAYCRKAEALFLEMDNDAYLASVYSNIGNVFVKSDQIEKALYYHEKGYELSLKIENLNYIIDDASNLATDHYKLGNYKLSSEFYKIFADSLVVKYEKLLDERFTEADAKFKAEEKDKIIAQQELEAAQSKTRQNRIIFGGVILLLILLGIYQWYIYRQRKKKDAAEQKLLKEQEMNQIRTTFLENVAHEIRTPITLINGHLSLVLEQGDTTPELKRHVQLALDNSQRLLSNSNEILDLLRYKKGKLPLRLTNLPLNVFLKRLFYSFESLAEIKKVELKFNSNAPDELLVHTDESRLEKILGNLISNAIKFSPSDSTIEFNVHLEPNRLTIHVRDYGQGIEVGEQKKIFERFYQSKHTDSAGGVGVGLSLAKEFAESLDGNLSVESQPGSGSTFCFVMPVNAVENKTTTESEVEEPTAQREPEADLAFLDEKKPHVLIVEDNPEMNAFLGEILSEHYSCDTCFDGIEGLQKVQNTDYDLIISDVMMPNMNGFEFREKMLSLEKQKLIPFIFLTAKVLLEDKVKGFDMGIDDYITKPFDKIELIARIQSSLANKRERERWIKDNLEFVPEEGQNAEKDLLIKIKSIVRENMANEDFKVTDLAEAMFYSQRQLSRLLKKSIGLSPVQYVLELRMQTAYQLLKEKHYSTLSEVRHHVGIPSASYFNKKFKERFGVTPSELSKE